MNTVENMSEPPLPEPPRHRNRVRALLVVISSIVLLGFGIAFWPKEGEWRYTGQLHSIIATADRIVVRDGGFDCCGPVDKEDILFEVTDLAEIREVLQNLEFRAKHNTLQRSRTMAGRNSLAGWG